MEGPAAWASVPRGPGRRRRDAGRASSLGWLGARQSSTSLVVACVVGLGLSDSKRRGAPED